MKKTILILSMISNTVFAVDLENVAKDFADNFKFKFNESFSSLVCGVSGCSLDMIENEMIIGNIMFSIEKNQINHAIKTNVEFHDMITNDLLKTTIICLSNNECKFFETKALDKANFSYESGQFSRERNKRSPRAHSSPVIMAVMDLANKRKLSLLKSSKNLEKKSAN